MPPNRLQGVNFPELRAGGLREGSRGPLWDTAPPRPAFQVLTQGLGDVTRCPPAVAALCSRAPEAWITGWGQERKPGPRSSIQLCCAGDVGSSGVWEGFAGGGWAWRECPVGVQAPVGAGDPRQAGKLRTDGHEALGLPRNERGMGGSSVGKLGKRRQEKGGERERSLSKWGGGGAWQVGGVSFRAWHPAGRV